MRAQSKRTGRIFLRSCCRSAPRSFPAPLGQGGMASNPERCGVERWPELHYDDWKETITTLHLWTQVVGKIRLTQTPMVNHWWNVTLYVTSHGLTTSEIPYERGSFEIAFDFIDRRLRVSDSDGKSASFPLEPMTVAAFYARVMEVFESRHRRSHP